MKTSHVEGRSHANGHRTPIQLVADTHHHKPDAPKRRSGHYSTAGEEHLRNHPAAELPQPMPARTIPNEVTIWNVESRASLSVVGAQSMQGAFRLKRELWEAIGRPGRVDVTGDPRTGFKITWGDDYACQSNTTKGTRSFISISVNAKKAGLPLEHRGAIVLRACARNGVIEVDAPNPLWTNGDPAFVPREKLSDFEVGKPAEKRLSANPQNGSISTKPAPSPTAPLPKARPVDMPVPTDTDLIKAALRDHMEKATRLKAELERKIGLKCKFIGDGKGGLDIKIEM